ncbi:MAG: HAMP domain-containing sensor histidine kinase [Thermosynechococcaceae cyanobacterium]
MSTERCCVANGPLFPIPVIKINLQSRLFLSHLIVMIVGVSTLVTVGKLYSPQFFVLHLDMLEGEGFRLGVRRDPILKGFDTAWSKGATWSVLAGGTAAGVLSWLAARRIVQPLLQMEKVTRQFAQGHLDARLPQNEVPELNQFASSFNRMAANLADVEQRRREIVSDLSHELRTPLTILEGYLEGLADGAIAPSPDIYQRLAQETARLRRLVVDLQELSQAETGYLPIRVQAFTLPPILHNLIQKFSDQILESGPSLSLNCASDLPLILADPERVEQVLVNLIGNAISYTQEGSITVSAHEVNGMAWISVKDTGQGIAAEDLPHVFERFWRSERARSERQGGTGIGLAISRRLVELQGGEIQVESVLNAGSTFRFSLPLVS